MSDELRRRLARAAGDGDIDAAKRLVVLLQREGLARDWPLTPETKLRDLADEDFGGTKKWGRKVRVLNVVTRAMADAMARHLDPRVAQALFDNMSEPTLLDVSALSVQELARTRDCGQTILASIDAVLARAGLTLRDDPTLRMPYSLPMASPSASPSPSEGRAP